MRSRLGRICGYGLGVITMFLVSQGHVLAGTLSPAPEIDPLSISAAVGVVAAGVLILRSRRRVK